MQKCIFILLVLFSGLLFIACTKKSTDFNTGSQNVLPPFSDSTKSYLALGDSYTIGQSVSPEERYPVQAVTALRAQGYHLSDPEIIAVTGWTTNNLIHAVNQRTFTKSYDLVSLLIGVNNQYQGRSISEYEEEFKILLDRSIQLAGGKTERVIVLSIPDYGVTSYGRTGNMIRIGEEIDAFNAVNARLSSDKKVTYLDITPESRKALNDHTLVAIDGLHYSGKAYKIWADMLVPLMKEKLK